ncbi:MAG: dockerin type I domain-containing protein [Candidatus Shapirobacteria bacterium]
MKLGWVIFALLFLLVPTETAAIENVTKKVLVLDFNPIIESRGNKKLTEVLGWNDPLTLEEKYVNDITEASGGYLRYEIKERQVLDAFPIKTDGFKYTDEAYLDCNASGGSRCHSPDEMDYQKVIAEYGVCERVNSGEIDELWLWGGPWFGYMESTMAGPGAFGTNGGAIGGTNCNKKLNIMGFSYHVGVDNMLEDLGHRFEGTMIRLFGGWDMKRGKSPFDKFTYNFVENEQREYYGCGNVHCPFNCQGGYDWGNPRYMNTNCNDWVNYPNLTGKVENINCTEWGCNGYGYKKWWLAHLPKSTGVTEGVLNNWWEYLSDWDKAIASTPTSHRDGWDWCPNHGGMYKRVDRDVSNWKECLEWCDLHMSFKAPLCQYNGDGPRSCWVNYPPGGVDGKVESCNWLVGGPPNGAWFIGLEPTTPPTITPASTPIPIPESKPLVCGSYGDVDNNGLITTQDSNLVEQYDVGLIDLSETQLVNADVNADKEVNVMDSLLIGRYVKGIILTFPVCSKIPGDANRDGTVNLVDLGIWKTEYVEKVGKSGDFNGDGVVNLTDLGIWKTEYVN